MTLLTRSVLRTSYAAHVRQVQIEKDDVVVVELAEIDALLAEIGRVDVEPLGLKHQLDALRCRAVVLDQKDPHVVPLFQTRSRGPLPNARRDYDAQAKSPLSNLDARG